MLAKRRGAIREWVNRVIYTGGGYQLMYVDRDPVAGERLRRLEVERIVKVTGWAVYLDDDSVIPLHRIVEVRDSEGRVVWSRRQSTKGRDTGL